MTVTDDQFEAAARVLACAKVFDQSIANGDELMIDMWARALFARADWPVELLERAVIDFYEGKHGEHISVAAILTLCRKYRAEQIERETEPERDRRLYERDRRLGLDTSWHQPNPALREGTPEDRDGIAAITERWSVP